MKVFPQASQEQFQQVSPSTLNDNTFHAIGQYNGRLDGQNIPVASIGRDKFKPPTVTTTNNGNVRKIEMFGQTQDYYMVRRWNTEEDGENWYEYGNTYALNASPRSSGWNTVGVINNDYKRVYLEFDAKEGALNGCADINFRRGTDLILDDNSVIQEIGLNNYVQWGVFCNQILVAETGRLYPQCFNVSLPFKLLCGSQNIRLELKWKLNYSNEWNQLPAKTESTPRDNLEIFGLQIWVCNTKR
jgi:hypothetical protein